MSREHVEHRELGFWCTLPHNISVGLSVPLIVIYLIDTLNGSVVDVSLVVLATALGSVPGSILWGHLSDRIGHRRGFLVLGFAGYGAVMSLLPFSPSILTYLALNFTLGLLGSAVAPVATALAIENSREEHRAERLGSFNAVVSGGHILGVLLGFGWSTLVPGPLIWLFLVGGLLGVCGVLLTMLIVTEPSAKIRSMPLFEHHVHAQTIERTRFLPTRMFHTPHLVLHLRSLKGYMHSRIVSFATSIFLVFTGFTAFYSILPIFLLSEIGIRPSDIFLIYLAGSLASTLTHIPAGRWLDRHGYRRALPIFSVVRAVLFLMVLLPIGLVPLSYWMGVAWFSTANFLAGIVWSFFAIASVAAMSSLVPVEARGGALGLYSSVQGAGTITGSLVIGFVAHGWGYPAAGVSIALLVLAGSILAYVSLFIRYGGGPFVPRARAHPTRGGPPMLEERPAKRVHSHKKAF